MHIKIKKCDKCKKQDIRNTIPMKMFKTDIGYICESCYLDITKDNHKFRGVL